MIENKESAAVWEDINALKPWENNPRNNSEAVSVVANSIERFGFGAPIIARKNGEIIAGHTRFLAAQQLKLDRVPVRYLDLDPVDSQLLAIADNKIGEIAEWDNLKLGEILSSMIQEDIDLDNLGFDEGEISDLVSGFEDLPEEETDDDSDNSFDADWLPDDDQLQPRTKPGDVVQIGQHTLYCGDCIEVLKTFPENSFDSVVTDPPYGIGFMSSSWDCSVPSKEWAEECLRVLKPGGYLIAFAATRTIHRLTVAVEDAGFQIRNQIGWCFFSGFPKSMDLSKAIDKHFGAEREVVGTKITGRALSGINWSNDIGGTEEITITEPATEEAKKYSGWGTALKPAYEPAVLARKPLSEKTVALNVLKWGTGGINIDDCRFAYGDSCWIGPQEAVSQNPPYLSGLENHRNHQNGRLQKNTSKIIQNRPSELGRWPANLYQCPKASRSEREEGCDDLDPISGAEATQRKPETAGLNNPRAGAGRTANEVRNIHPTVKPVRLMQWLCRLVTPKEGTILETFAGSGTTMIAAELESFSCTGIEREPKYCDIIRARIEHQQRKDNDKD